MDIWWQNFLKDKIQVGDSVLFYASNTKGTLPDVQSILHCSPSVSRAVPGITALASCTRAGYPDFNAWDPAHPYYDPKSSADKPTWFMVDLLFGEHLPHPVPLRLLQFLSTAKEVPECFKDYITADMLVAISDMVLVKKGRLSVQPVAPLVYDAIQQIGTRGGWADWFATIPKAAPVKRKKAVDDTGVKGEEEEGGKKKKAKVSENRKGKSKQVDSAGEEDELLSDLSPDEEKVDVKPLPSPQKAPAKTSKVESRGKKLAPKKESTTFRDDEAESESEEEVIRTTAGGRAARNSARNGI